MTVDHLVGQIDRQREFKPRASQGLAQFLAERGLLPMYDMPTRIRDLYLGLRAETDERDTEYSWSTMDGDLDTAVFEFAPGNVLTKDKQQHLVIGFSGTLAQPESAFEKRDFLCRICVIHEVSESTMPSRHTCRNAEGAPIRQI